MPELLAAAAPGQSLYFEDTAAPRLAGARIDAADPLAVLDHGRRAADAAPGAPADTVAPDGTRPLAAPLQGTVVNLFAAEGDEVRAGQPLLVMEAMKMEHVIAAEVSGVLRRLAVAPGDTVWEGAPLLFVEEREVEGVALQTEATVDLDLIAPTSPRCSTARPA
jgi:biotin carboxyl carrier protein